MPNVFHSIQYIKATGQIIGRVSGGVRIPDENFPPEAAQIVLELDDKITAPDITERRVNLAQVASGADPADCVETCPVLALQTQVNGIMGQLAACDARRDRALAEAFVSGDHKWLKKHLGDADDLRAKMADLNKQIAAVPPQKGK